MNITTTMNLAQLAERMGDCATEAEARVMRELLCDSGYEGCDTIDIPADVWMQAMSEVAAIAQAELEALGFADRADYEAHQAVLKDAASLASITKTIVIN